MSFPSGLVSATVPDSLAGQISFVALSRGRVSYAINEPINHNGRTALFVYGLTGPLQVLDNNAKALVDEGFRVLRYDFYGRGFSDEPDVNQDLSLFVGQLKELVDTLNIVDPVDLIGSSLGCAIAVEFARLYPSSVRSLVLAASIGYSLINTRPGPMALPWLGRVFFALVGRKAMKKWADAHFTTSESEAYKSFMHYQHLSLDHNPGFLRSIWSTLSNFPYNEMKAQFAEVGQHTRPVLILGGAADQLIVPAALQLLAADFPHSRLQFIPKGGHAFLVEFADDANQAIAQFYREQQQFNEVRQLEGKHHKESNVNKLHEEGGLNTSTKAVKTYNVKN